MNRIFINKSILKFLIIVFLLFLCSCESVEEHNISVETKIISTEVITEVNKEKLLKFLESDDVLESPSREYGNEEFISVNKGDFYAHVVYPKGDLKELDKLCEDWAKSTLDRYQKESKSANNQLSISYNSYVVNDKYVVVEFNGEYYSQDYAHPASIFTTFNAEIESGKVLTIGNYLSEEQIGILRQFIVKEKKVKKELLDESLLDNWKISDDGIEIVLEKGKYLPESEGNVDVFVSNDILNLKEETKIADSSKSKETKDTKNEATDKEKENIDKATSDSSADETDVQKDYDKVIAITFDDGPGAHTARLLDILKKHNVKATFFVLGSQIDTNPDLLPRMIEEGHEVCSHSWTHRNFTDLSEEELTKEIMQTRAKIASLTGVDTLVVRPPYGAYNDVVQAIGKKLGVHFVNWDVDPVDWMTRDAKMTYDAIIKDSSNGSIVLCHDIHSSTVDSMESVIPKLLEQGYHFVTVSELLDMGTEEVQPGEIYFSISN